MATMAKRKVNTRIKLAPLIMYSARREAIKCTFIGNVNADHSDKKFYHDYIYSYLT